MMLGQKPDNPLDRRIAIMIYYEKGYFIGSKSAEEIRDELGGNINSISRALKELGFTIAEKRKEKRVKTGQGRKSRKVVTHRKWAPPPGLAWPVLSQLQRQIRMQGASPQAVKRAFTNADVPASVMEQALGQLVLEGKTAGTKGALKKSVSAVIAEQAAQKEETQRLEEYGRDPYWAEVLRESPDLPRKALRTRTDGLIRAATRKGSWP